jgi:MtN3 and saliva related transmembrane protein
MFEIIGYVAAFLTTGSFLPQVIKTIKTGDTSGISLWMYSMFVCGIFLWLIYTIYLENLTMIIANSITLFLSSIVLVIKIKNIIKR